MCFCDICDQPYPLAMMSDSICAGCWREHAAELAEDPYIAQWAATHVRVAEGPRLLPAIGAL